MGVISPQAVGIRKLMGLAGLSTLIVGAAASPVRCQPAACASFTDAARRACQIAASLPKQDDAPGSGEGIGGGVVAPLSPEAFRAVSVEQLAADPSAYRRQPVAVGSAQCFYFGVGDYRCVVPGAVPLVVRGTIMIPAPTEVAVEQGCRTGGGLRSCAFRLFVVPSSLGADGSGPDSIVAVRTANIMALPDDDADAKAAVRR